MSDQPVSGHSDRFDVRVTAESHFAWLRTRLAVERTMMACLRTAVSPAVVAVREYRWTLRYLWGGRFAAIAGMTQDGKHSPLDATAILPTLIGLFTFYSVRLNLA
jgi:putative membrane protein